MSGRKRVLDGHQSHCTRKSKRSRAIYSDNSLPQEVNGEYKISPTNGKKCVDIETAHTPEEAISRTKGIAVSETREDSPLASKQVNGEQIDTPNQTKGKAHRPVEQEYREREREGVQVHVKKRRRETGKRKTKEEKAAEMAPLAARTSGLRMYVGAHVSAAKGVCFAARISFTPLLAWQDARYGGL